MECNSKVVSNQAQPGEAPLLHGYPTVSRPALRHQLRQQAKEEVIRTYGFISERSRSVHYGAQELSGFPRRARRRIILGVAKRWYRQIRTELQGKVAIPSSALDRFKSTMLPAWLKKHWQVKHRLVEAAMGAK